jgi:transposase
MEILYEKCAGLDVHKDEVVASLRVAVGRTTQREQRRFGTTTSALMELTEWLIERGCTHVVMEATGVYWRPVWHVLEGSFELFLANARDVRNLPGRKTDMNDAAWLSDLLAHGLIRSSFVPPAPIQELRDLTRTRKQLSRAVGQHTLRIQKTLEDANVKLSSVISDTIGMTGRRILEAIVGGETDPNKLAALAGPRIKATPKDLAEALRGKVTRPSPVHAEATPRPNRCVARDDRAGRCPHRRACHPFSRCCGATDDDPRDQSHRRPRHPRRGWLRHHAVPDGSSSRLVGRTLPSRR